jgi:mRNA interferase MazF
VEVKRGEIFLADLNPVMGTEQAGIRPVLVIQIDKANAVSPHTIIIPFTTKIRRAILPSHTEISKGVGGLTKDSVVLCEQIRVIDKKRLIKKLGDIGSKYLEEVADTLRIILGLE